VSGDNPQNEGFTIVGRYLRSQTLLCLASSARLAVIELSDIVTR
jgi:hypothetical protein